MPAQKKTTKKSTKKTTVSRSRRTNDKKTVWEMVKPWLVDRKNRAVNRFRAYRKRRPHRSFRLTRKRDYQRSLTLPGYWSFTNHVRKVLWDNRKLFGGLILSYVVATVIISGFGAQQVYDQLSTRLQETGGHLFQGNVGAIAQSSLLLVASLTQGLSPNLTPAQSIFGGLVFFYVWLATIWLLRNVLAGNKPKLRDGLYNSGAPALATVLVGFIIMVQLLPAAIALIAYDAAQVSGLMEGGVTAMLAWTGVAALCLISVYWLIGSLIALIIVTLPGMYPMRAIRAAGDMVVGRRVRILFRLLWLGFIIVLAWALLVIPAILFDDWIKDVYPAVSWVPFVPLVIFTMSSVTVVFAVSYFYLLYRRIVDDDAPPA